MKNLPLLSIIITLFFVNSCKGPNSKTVSEDSTQVVIEYNNPPAEGFDLDGSHPIAVLLADQVMNAMGGRAKWDATNVIYWNFFGKRTLLWDKQNNWVRVDTPETKSVVVLNMNDNTGRAWQEENEILDSVIVMEKLKQAKNAWINDSYWLVMPFKLKDSGVTLSYLREDTTQMGEKCDVLGLRFSSVGNTPQNGYEVWVSIDSRLIKQWAYFNNSEDENASFILPWDEYQSYDGLLLSGNRGDRKLTDIAVLSAVPTGAFDSPKAIEFQ
jgi:hypothetical protein